MRTCLITTTINTPTVLELYKQHGPDVHIIVAGDLKTPQAAADWCHAHDITYLSHGVQREFGYKCSELIGWNSIQRRNIALLEAIKWGADIIVSVDDDNICLDSNYFSDFTRHWQRSYVSHDGSQGGSTPRRIDAPALPFSGIKVSSDKGWFDVGQLLAPIAPHRGFPISVDATKWSVSHVTGARVGLAAGCCLGDPDISAVTRISRAPIVHQVSELLNSGIVVDPSTKTVFNSQNTAFIRELAPAFFMLPGVGRYDDIYASLIMQRVMRERNLHVHFGKPFVWQQRNQHNLVKDLRGEIDGMENIQMFVDYIDTITLGGKSVINDCRLLWLGIADGGHNYVGGFTIAPDLVPPQTIEAALAFLEDMEGVL